LKGALEATGFDELPKDEYDYLLSAVKYVATEERDLYVINEELYNELKTLYHEWEKKHNLYQNYENTPDQPEGIGQGHD
jgi:hypothetical protein